MVAQSDQRDQGDRRRRRGRRSRRSSSSSSTRRRETRAAPTGGRESSPRRQKVTGYDASLLSSISSQPTGVTLTFSVSDSPACGVGAERDRDRLGRAGVDRGDRLGAVDRAVVAGDGHVDAALVRRRPGSARRRRSRRRPRRRGDGAAVGQRRAGRLQGAAAVDQAEAVGLAVALAVGVAHRAGAAARGAGERARRPPRDRGSPGRRLAGVGRNWLSGTPSATTISWSVSACSIWSRARA